MPVLIRLGTWFKPLIHGLDHRIAVGVVAAVLVLPATAPTPVIAVAPGSAGKIVFVSNHERGELVADLFTMDPDGSGVTRITNDTPDPSAGLRYNDPAWSPNGQRIAAFRSSSSSALVTMDANGANLTPVIAGVAAFGPTWAPDGLTLYYSDGLSGYTSPAHLWKVGVDGSNPTQLTTGDGHDTDPAVNPAGTKIAFERSGQIGTVSLSGTGYANLTPSVTDAGKPNWSPDGNKIVFARQFQGIWTVNADGTGLAKLGAGTWLSDATEPAWSPDGARIVIHRAVPYGGISTMATDATCASSLFVPASPFVPQQPDWQPVPNPTQFRIATPPRCPTAYRGVATSMTVNITRSSGFTGAVTLSASLLPPGMTATFSPNPATGSTTTLTVKATECPTTTPLGPYRLRITGVSGATSRTGFVDVIVDDGLPVMLSGPTSRLVAGRTVSTASVPVQTTWLACNEGAPVSYVAQRWKASTWATVLTSSATSISQSLSYGSTYRYRVKARAIDDYSTYRNGSYFQPLLTQQTSTSVHYGGTWISSSSTNYLGGSIRYSTAGGASASYAFTGASIAWIGSVGPTRGQAKVYIDGVLKGTIDTYASSAAHRRTLFAYSWSSQSSHTIKIVVVGTAGHARVDVDGFVRLYRT